ncbi:hypothetical protein MRX96_038139 [Rhipicephalus microplus]
MTAGGSDHTLQPPLGVTQSTMNVANTVSLLMRRIDQRVVEGSAAHVTAAAAHCPTSARYNKRGGPSTRGGPARVFAFDRCSRRSFVYAAGAEQYGTVPRLPIHGGGNDDQGWLSLPQSLTSKRA